MHNLAQSSVCRGADRPACAGVGSRNRPAFRQSFCGRSLAIGLILLACLTGCEPSVSIDGRAGFEDDKGTNDVESIDATFGGELKGEIPGV